MSTLAAAPSRSAAVDGNRRGRRAAPPTTSAASSVWGRDAASTEEARRRGRLVLSEKVVVKIASQAAAETGAAYGTSGGFLGIGVDPDPAARPKVDVTLTAQFADISIEVGIRYPGSIRRAVDDVRQHVADRVHALTGVVVRRVDVNVTFLTVSAPAERTRKVLR